ncbi:ribonuclease H [Vibrio phage VP4B]|uniref:ribonuclease H n=1 Tax=Vibrio phage VP4B TaxID=1262540 RepID=V9M0C8_9CAUD|nr:Rnase H [Vibrio phage VP4B]AGB07291.1 ribonuclease H [Vibrio phage VP4B]
MLIINTDGSCIGKSGPGPSGYGIVVRDGDVTVELSDGYAWSTNNRMELLAPIIALEGLTEPRKVSVTTDSQYVKQGIEQWVHGWLRRGWKRADGGPVKNEDLWRRLYDMTRYHNVKWHWVKGHSGDPDNERCDTMAQEAARANPTKIDHGYYTYNENLPKYESKGHQWWKYKKR